MADNFDLFVTSVDKIGPMLKIWGQVDRLSSMLVEQLLKTSLVHFQSENNVPHISKLSVGLKLCAKYKDGHYYRAEITNLRQLVFGSVEVKFIDYGNVEIIALENLRLMEDVPSGLNVLHPQAIDFILANVCHVNHQWDDKALSFIHSEIAYMELKSTVVGALKGYKFIKIMFHDIDLSEYLVQRGIAVPVSLAAQENIITNPNLYQISPSISNMPMLCPTERSVNYQPQYEQPLASATTSAQEFCNFKTHPLKEKSEHMVYISYVEDGPYLFSIQLQSMEEALEKLMIEINQKSNLLPLTESPVPGCPCLARCLEDNSLCRAVVINLVEDKCKTYFVDFGNTDILPFSHIFQIPFKYILPKVMSIRFTLAGLKNIKVTNEMKCAFKEYVTNRLLKLKVLKLDGSVLQYCELYDEENRNVINKLYDQANNYKSLIINKGLKYNVIVSFIQGCKKFFVQLKDCSASLSNLMLALANNSDSSPPLQALEVGVPCVAFYSGDNQWYRAEILSIGDETVTVKYVDYGNEGTVPNSCLKQIDSNFVKILPAQAIECCLYGYQNMSFNNEIESVFESLTLECEFTMKVISKQNNDSTLLVDLFDAGDNNVAALLIEKLASQKSQITSLPANRITKSLLNNAENINQNTENQHVEIKSLKLSVDNLPWRNSTNDKSRKHSGNEKNFRNEERIIRINADNSPPKFRNSRVNNRKVYNKKRNRVQNSWNGDSPTNKRSQRTERSFSRGSNNSRQGRDTGKFNKRSPNNNTWNNSGSESEKSWSENSVGSRSGKYAGYKKDFKQKRNNDFPKKNNFTKPNDFAKAKIPVELPPQDLAALTDPFTYVDIAPGASECISISWFYNPVNFFCQFLKNEKDFRDMMNDIQSAYNGRPPISSDTEIPTGASVIAEFHEDTILYRAIVLENKLPKYKVQYIDFGNISLVDHSKIWQVEKKFMTLPMQAIKCGIANITSVEENWPEATIIDNIFNKESFTCTFVGCNEEQYFIELFDNHVNIKEKLIESRVAVDPSITCEMVDEPVDLNILIGQNILVSVSFVEGLNKFYIHLQKEKAMTVQSSIETYMKSVDLNNIQKLTEDQIITGATCLVQGNDEKWKRAVVTNNSDMATVQVDYPDFGGNGTYSADEIYALPQQLCIYWYQAFECSLFNLSVENKLTNDEDFKTNYEGKNLIIYIEEIVNTRLFVTLYDTNGKKLELIHLVNNEYSIISPLCPMPILNITFTAYVTHVNNVGSLFLQRDSDSISITALLESLFNFYESNNELVTLNRGEICCVKSDDGNWYRGRIEELNDETAKVLYIDYGNTECLPKDNLRALDSSFFNHELAVHVSLNLTEISPELTNTIIELTNDKSFTATISFGDLGWIVELVNEEFNLNQTLVDLNLATYATEYTETSQEIIIEETESEGVTTELVVEDENRAQVKITHIDSPSEFYVQLVANEDSIYALQTDLQEKINNLPDLDGADIGVLCAAKYTVDEQWYRAEVLDADSEITTVRFVDYGNTDVITNNQGSIKTLSADLLAIDKYARKCSLNIIPSKGEEWSQEASEMFENAVNSEIIHADIVYQDEKNKTYIDVYINGNNIALQLLNNNLAISITRDVEDNIANNTGFVSHVNSISEFWIQLESSVPDLEMIVDRLANADSFADLQDLSPGILCAANFPDDEMWYRARILSNTVAGVEVLFVDYGNSSTAMKLKVLPEDLIQMSILAQKCSLNKPSGITSWSEQATEKFREISEEGATIFTIKKLAAGETSIVELYIEENNIVDQLIDLCEQNVSERMTPIGEPNYTKVFITHIETPSYFWVQLSSDSEKIDEMTEILASAGSFKKLVNWNIDTICVALYMNTGLWYRAKVLELVDQYEVLLVDYGNIIFTEDLRALPADIASVPPLATLCTLQLPDDISDWNEITCSKFINLVDISKECRVEFIDNEVPCTVRLFSDDKNVAEEICSDKPQAPLTSISSISLASDEISLLAVNTQLPEPLADVEDIQEIPEIEQSREDTSFMNESFITVKEDSKENSHLNDSNETIKESSFAEVESVEPILVNQDNFLSSEILTNEKLNILEKQNSYIIHNERVVPGSLSNVNSTEKIKTEVENVLGDLAININKVAVRTRPVTPHCEKIVPGSVCRGNIEEFLDEIESEIERVIEEPVVVKSRPVTPHSEKIVPGSICRGIMEKIPLNYINDDINIPVTLVSDKIVPGSICRGDLEEPDDIQNEIIRVIEEHVIVKSRPVTPHAERIVPGSICRGITEQISLNCISDDINLKEHSINDEYKEKLDIIPETSRKDKIVHGPQYIKENKEDIL